LTGKPLINSNNSDSNASCIDKMAQNYRSDKNLRLDVSDMGLRLTWKGGGWRDMSDICTKNYQKGSKFPLPLALNAIYIKL
jgi:hypothetical protein